MYLNKPAADFSMALPPSTDQVNETYLIFSFLKDFLNIKLSVIVFMPITTMMSKGLCSLKKNLKKNSKLYQINKTILR